MSILVVYYSRSGTTAHQAETLARWLKADCDAISAGSAYDGPLGLVNAAMTAALDSQGPATTSRHVRAYNHVIVGGPVWGGQLPGPLRRYLACNPLQNRLAGAFCTSWHGGTQRAFFDEIRQLVGTRTFPTCSIEQRLCDEELLQYDVAKFARTLSASLTRVA